jgi:AraC-like DNA-binding protein
MKKLPRHKVWSDLKRFKDNVYYHYSVADETFVPSHQHEHSQLIYTEGGRVYVTAENRIWYLPARHYMWIPARVNHAIQISMPTVLLWTIYFPVCKNESPFYKKPGIYAVNNLLLELIYFTQSWKGPIKRNECSRYALTSAIKALLPEISKTALPFDLPIPKDSRLQQIVRYLHDNLSYNILIRDIAGKFSISERTIARMFKKDLKMSFITYLETLRMIRAIELLTIGELTIKEICFQVGYESVPSFSNMFKKIVGVRPTSYNKK